MNEIILILSLYLVVALYRNLKESLPMLLSDLYTIVRDTIVFLAWLSGKVFGKIIKIIKFK